MCVFVYVSHGHCGPLVPYPGPHTSWDPVVGSHTFAGADGGLVGLVGLVGSVVGFALGGLDSSFVGAGVWAFSCPPGPLPGTALPPRGWGKGGSGTPRTGWCARVFHPNGTVLPPMDTANGALLYPGGVRDVDDRPEDRIHGAVVRLGGVNLGWRRGGAGRWRFSGVGGFGGGDGLRRPCGGGLRRGAWAFWPGALPRRQSRRTT